VTASIQVGGESETMGYNPATGRLLVGVTFSEYVATIDTATNQVVARTTDRSWPYGMAPNPRSGSMWVDNFLTGDVVALAGPDSVATSRYSAGAGPAPIAFDPGNGHAYIGDQSTNVLEVLNSTTGRLITSIGLNDTPMAIAYDPAAGSIEVAGRAGAGTAGNLTVVNDTTEAIAAQIPIAGDPNAVAYDSATREVYVAASGTLGGFVEVLNASSQALIATISVGPEPTGLAVATFNGDVYVSDGFADNLTVISASTHRTIGAIPVGETPIAVSYDADASTIYVLNYGGDSVTVVPLVPPPARYPVAFSETGLPSGTPWSVTLNGVAHASNASTIAFSETNGTLPYTVGGVAGFIASPRSGSVTVSGASASVSVAFVLATYSVSFVESGLASGSSWSVTFDAAQNTSTSNTIGFWVANGTDLTYAIAPAAGYSATPASGTLSVAGRPLTESIAFLPDAPSVDSFSVTPSNVTVGGIVVFNASVAHGKAPITYSYTSLPSGCSSTNAPTLRCAPADAGAFTVTLTVKDALSRSAHATVNLTVHRLPSSPAPTFLGMPQALGYGLLAGIVLVLIGVAVAVAYLLRRRRSSSGPAGPSPSPEPPPTA
jgi:DNA-binding beta-propeller fold protein YncE